MDNTSQLLNETIEEEHRTYPMPSAELGLVVLYVLFACGWITGSQMLLDWAGNDPIDSVPLQTFKGLNFVLTTGLLLYFILRRSFNRRRRAEQRDERARQKLRALTSRLQSLREEERTRISREIHDELGQMLTGVKMDLRWIERRVPEDPSLNPVLEKIVEATELVDNTIASVQRISSELRPGLLDNLGLGAAMSREAERFEELNAVSCQIKCSEDNTMLPPGTAIAVFRIFQEALTNITRHAEALQVSSELQVTDHELTLEIVDNGKGITEQALDDPGSLGLLGMRERATMLGGELSISPNPGGGTAVHLWLPLRSSVRSFQTV